MRYLKVNLRSAYNLLLSSDREMYRSLKNITGFCPGNLSLYKLAFSHRSTAASAVNGVQLSNERLEFLGDAVLGAIIADMLFRRFPFRDEGFLTEMRSRIVSRENLKNLALKIGVDKYMRTTNQPGSFRSMYGDAFEALIGAIFLDKGYACAEEFVISRIVNVHIDLNAIEKTDTNFKSRIINWGQREKKTVVFETTDEGIGGKLIKVQLLVDGVVVANGEDYVKKKAEQIAASKACESLGISAD